MSHKTVPMVVQKLLAKFDFSASKEEIRLNKIVAIAAQLS
jgi:hypothetical protein